MAVLLEHTRRFRVTIAHGLTRRGGNRIGERTCGSCRYWYHLMPKCRNLQVRVLEVEQLVLALWDKTEFVEMMGNSHRKGNR